MPTVKIDKRQLVDFFMTRGDVDLAERADDSLPDPVDLHAQAEALKALGIDAGLLATQLDNLEA